MIDTAEWRAHGRNMPESGDRGYSQVNLSGRSKDAIKRRALGAYHENQ